MVADSAGGCGVPSRPPSLDLGGPSAFRPVMSSFSNMSRPGGLNLSFGCNLFSARGDDVDPAIPLERQGLVKIKYTLKFMY